MGCRLPDMGSAGRLRSQRSANPHECYRVFLRCILFIFRQARERELHCCGP